jgi:hypothetical protein
MNEEYDFNGNGKIDPEERAIMLDDMRRHGSSLTGMLVFPFGVVFTEWMQLSNASNITIQHE